LHKFKKSMNNIFKQAILASIKGGDKILEVYETDFDVSYKGDDSPLTIADQKANGAIVETLEPLGIEMISEENKNKTYDERQNWNQCWIIDPLDGTKEFIKRNGEFTVNIALIHQDKPILGVIYAPVLDTIYYGDRKGAFKEKNGIIRELKSSFKNKDRVAVKSKSHASEEEDKLFAKYDVGKTISVGSSLKYCMLAEGKADIYYRHGPTMEWDTAAGQAIVIASGGTITKPDASPFIYNKEILRNGSFLSLGRKM